MTPERRAELYDSISNPCAACGSGVTASCLETNGCAPREKQIGRLADEFRAAVLAEREACAKVVDPGWHDFHSCNEKCFRGRTIAAEIRNRPTDTDTAGQQGE